MLPINRKPIGTDILFCQTLKTVSKEHHSLPTILTLPCWVKLAFCGVQDIIWLILNRGELILAAIRAENSTTVRALKVLGSLETEEAFMCHLLEPTWFTYRAFCRPGSFGQGCSAPTTEVAFILKSTFRTFYFHDWSLRFVILLPVKFVTTQLFLCHPERSEGSPRFFGRYAPSEW